MSIKKYVEFRKKRELGDVISDTFKFLRTNAKPLFKVLVRTCIIPFILLIVAIGFYTNESSGANLIATLSTESDIIGFVLAGCGLAIAGIIYNSMLYGSTSEYIKAYVSIGEAPETDAIVETIKKKTGNFLALGFVNLLIVLGVALIPAALGGFLIASGSNAMGVILLLLLFFPLLYIYTKLMVIFPAMVNKDLTVVASLKESWRLVKDEWWITFFTVLIIAFLIGIIGFVFQIPAVIYLMIKTFTAASAGSLNDPASLYDTVSIVLQTLASSMNYILYVILAIAINLIYFNLNERKDQSGSLDQIDSIGRTNA